MSTYSPNLRLELIGTGDQAGTWGNTTNTNLGTLIESAVAGYISVSVTSASQALTALNGAEDQSRNLMLALTTTTLDNFAVYAPPAEKSYIVYNASVYNATLYNSTVIGNTTAAGTGVTVPPGRTMAVWTDGTNFRAQVSHLPALTLTVPLALADGGTGGNSAASARSNLGLGSIATQNANLVSITGGSISGIVDLAVADGGTGASTAADARTNLGLGSIATQNANAVAITGGAISGATISGIPDLAIVDGGTGASTAAAARTNLGLDTMAVQNSASVSITGGSITGITDIAVADGGTGSSTAAGARTNLGLVIGTDVAPVSSPVFTGDPRAPTPAASDNDTSIATTAFVQSLVATAVSTAVANAKLALHPVGSIYINATNNTNPATLLGFGTWVAFGAGRVPVGFDAGNSNFNAAEKTGGSYTTDSAGSHSHSGNAGSTALTEAQMPKHFHRYVTGQLVSGSYPNSPTGNQNGYFFGGTPDDGAFEYNTYSTGGDAASGSQGTGTANGDPHTHTISADGTHTHTALPAYITVYMWKRTA